MNQPLSTIMTKDVVTVTPQDSLSKVKKLIFDNRFHHIPVIENGKLAGIVTSYDLMKLNKTFEEYENIKVEEVMTKKVLALKANEKIGTAAQIFLRQLFHGLPIVDEDNVLKGIVTTHDILRHNYDQAYPDDSLEKAYRS